jgi:hypothetical protein
MRGVASRSDALQLAALTSLTKLDLSSAAGVDDVAASVLALRLTQLRELGLTNCGLRSAAALPSIATLTGLTCLDLTSDSAQTANFNLLPLGEEDVLLLTPLTQLKHFYYDGFFWSGAVSRLWSIQKGGGCSRRHGCVRGMHRSSRSEQWWVCRVCFNQQIVASEWVHMASCVQRWSYKKLGGVGHAL